MEKSYSDEGRARSQPGLLEVCFNEEGVLEITSPAFSGIGVHVERVDQTCSSDAPKEAVYKIISFEPGSSNRETICTAYVLRDGNISYLND